METTSKTTTQRKTKKYYRELIASRMLGTPVCVIAEVIKKYAPKDGWRSEIYFRREATPFKWNHRIERIGLNKSGMSSAYLDIYWQGDSTDGNTTVNLSDVIRAVGSGRDYVIPAEHEFINGRTYERFSDICISREEVGNAYKALINYLSPKSTKK